jgi:hypothetical protein
VFPGTGKRGHLVEPGDHDRLEAHLPQVEHAGPPSAAGLRAGASSGTAADVPGG